MVLNIADLRTVHAREALKQLRERFGDKVFDSVIRRSVRYAESAERGISILDHRPDLGADYLGLADEVLDRLGWKRRRLGELRPELAPACDPWAALRCARTCVPAETPEAYQARERLCPGWPAG